MMLTDLSHKRKTVSDLIRFIGNTTEYLESPERVNTPNYSILLGAGASVTSGIRSGQTLINEWKKEIYEESDKKDDIRSIPDDRDAIEKSMIVLSCLGKKDEIIEIYNGLTNKESYEEHFYNVIREYDKLIPLYSQKQANKGLTKSELISYAYSLLKLEKYSDVMTLLKPYYDNPVLVDGAIIVNYLFAKAKHEKHSEAKIKIKLKEKIIESKYNNYSNFEKLGASCVIGNINDIVSYLGKILKEDPISKYTIKEWPIMLPHLKEQKVNKLLVPTLKKIEYKS